MLSVNVTTGSITRCNRKTAAPILKKVVKSKCVPKQAKLRLSCDVEGYRQSWEVQQIERYGTQLQTGFCEPSIYSLVAGKMYNRIRSNQAEGVKM